MPEWAKRRRALLCYIGAVKGSDGKLLPQSSTSSLEALVIFLRCYKFTTSWDGTIEQPSLADDLVAYALTFEGYDYVYGGTTPRRLRLLRLRAVCLPPFRLQYYAHGDVAVL